MYPFVRMAKEIWLYRHAAPLGLSGEHVSTHRCWPWDLDFALELNNGRTLTLLDLGRIPLVFRTGLWPCLRRNGWGLTMAGVTVRYRRRIRVFHKVTLRSRMLFWDERFIYIEQAFFRRDGECATHALYRVAITSAEGIVPPPRVAQEMGHAGPPPEAPDWALKWIASEAARPWPPMQN